MNVLIKIGGSLLKEPPTVLSVLCKTICELSKKYKIILMAGGGKLADYVRAGQQKFKFSNDISHWMAIMTMDINGMLISEENDNFELVETVPECKSSLDKKNIPIFLPYNFLRKTNILPKSWDVTSDSIALFISHILNSRHVILLKNVDGIYKILNENEVVREITSTKIKCFKSTCIDSYLPNLVKKYNKKVYIVSGLYPERIEKILKSEEALCTKIIP